MNNFPIASENLNANNSGVVAGLNPAGGFAHRHEPGHVTDQGKPSLLSELRLKWRHWIENEIGGPEGRIEAATQAAMAAIAQAKSRDEVVAAARYAAGTWRSPASSTAAYVARQGIIRGYVVGMQRREQPFRWGRGMRDTIWNFWISRTGPDGKPLPPIPIVMQGHGRITGSIANGNEVEIEAPDYKPGETIRPRAVRNITTNSVVRVQIWPRIIYMTLGTIMFLGFLVFGILSVNPYAFRSPDPPNPVTVGPIKKLIRIPLIPLSALPKNK